LRLEANACWPGARVPRVRQRARGVEPVLIGGGASDFGTIAGAQTVAELQDLVNLWSTRMAQLTQAYADFSPTWVNKDAAGYEAWTNDWNALQARYQAALSNANSAITAAKINLFTPNNMIPAPTEYTALAKAMHQCYPPDGCPQAKGDWDDLFDRITAAQKAAGAAVLVDAPPQPTATDVDLKVFAATAPVDPIAQLTGQQLGGPLPTGTAAGLAGFLKWISAHKTAIEVGAVVVGAGVLLSLVLPAVMVPLKVAKLATAGAL
jgi:hypothetical protein